MSFVMAIQRTAVIVSFRYLFALLCWVLSVCLLFLYLLFVWSFYKNLIGRKQLLALNLNVKIIKTSFSLFNCFVFDISLAVFLCMHFCSIVACTDYYFRYFFNFHFIKSKQCVCIEWKFPMIWASFFPFPSFK